VDYDDEIKHGIEYKSLQSLSADTNKQFAFRYHGNAAPYLSRLIFN
jgi:hypothetical protein